VVIRLVVLASHQWSTSSCLELQNDIKTSRKKHYPPDRSLRNRWQNIESQKIEKQNIKEVKRRKAKDRKKNVEMYNVEEKMSKTKHRKNKTSKVKTSKNKRSKVQNIENFLICIEKKKKGPYT
jgi:hypothetical protein